MAQTPFTKSLWHKLWLPSSHCLKITASLNSSNSKFTMIIYSHLCHNKNPTRIETISTKTRLPPKIYGQVGSSSRKNKDDESIIFLFHLVIMINRHILKISSALLTFGQKLINRITYRLPTSYMYQQLANAQIKKIFIPIPMKVNINFKGERVAKSQNCLRRRRTDA